MAILAHGAHYFGRRGFPVTVRRVDSGRPGASHPHDITEREHYHDFSELVIVAGGHGRHLLEGQSFPIAGGDVFVLQGRQVHCFRERVELRLINVMYDPERLALPSRLLRRMSGYSALFMLEPAFRQAHRFASRLHLNRSDLGAAEALVRQIEVEATAQGEGHEAVLLSLLLQLMTFLSRRYGSSRDIEARSLLRVGQLIGTLERDYERPWSIEQLTAMTHLSRSSLIRTFRKATGQSPIDFLIRCRIEAAMRSLQQTEQSVTEIALGSGFADSNYFARQFRQICGCTPSDFRRRCRSRGGQEAPSNQVPST
jgi:AraC-like DNA-binding protein